VPGDELIGDVVEIVADDLRLGYWLRAGRDWGTTPSCFLTASRKGREEAGASSMDCGIGKRDMRFSFHVAGLRLRQSNIIPFRRN
jgi:hypothetical protein